MPGRVSGFFRGLFKPKANVKEVFGRANRVAGSRVVRTVAGTNKLRRALPTTRVVQKKILPKGSAVNGARRPSTKPIKRGPVRRGK